MSQVNQPSNLLDRLRRLEQTVQRVAAQSGLTSATINRGGLTLLQDAFLRVVDDQDIEILYIGPDDQGRQIIRIRREGGADVLFTYFTPGGQQYWALTDNAGNTIVSDDAVSGQGLARPYLQWACVPTSELLTIPASQATTSSTFTAVWSLFGEKTHPRLRAYTLTHTDVGTTGEIRLRDPATGTVVVGPTTLPSGDNSQRILDGPIDGGFSAFKNIDIEIRRTGGTGNVAARVMMAEGIQS